LPGKTLEQHSPDDLAAIGVIPVSKTEIVNLPSIGYMEEKTEGLALIPDGDLAVLNDNDFGVSTDPVPLNGTIPLLDPRPPTVLSIVELPRTPHRHHRRHHHERW